MSTVKTKGRDAPMLTNMAGGNQSASPYRCVLFPPRAFLAVAEVLAVEATKDGPDNWRQMGVRKHLDLCIGYLFAYLAGAAPSDLEHAACRIMMALDIKLFQSDPSNSREED